jgi:hypothetical protein
MTASNLIGIGKIENIFKENGKSFGFITPNSPIDNHTGNVRFDSLDVRDITFTELSKGDFVKFEIESRENGQSLVVARNVYATISGTIIFVRNNSGQQTFWGRIQCDENNFLKITNHVIFFDNNFSQTVTLEEVKPNSKVTFVVQNYQSTINNIDKKAKSIKFIEPNEKKIDVPDIPDIVDTVLDTNKIEETLSVFNTEILKINLINLLKKTETVRDHAEFEDLVFVLLRLLGIHKLYQYKRTNAAGRADGFFIVGNLSVIYDCTLRQDFSDYKGDQIKNYIHQISKDIFTVTKRDNIQYDIKITEHRQVWIITNNIITKRRSRTLRNFNSIWIKEVSVQSLIRLFVKRLNSATFEEETLADELRMIDRIDRGNPR